MPPTQATSLVQGVPFYVIVERNYAGVLPRSVIPIVLFIILVAGLASTLVGSVTRHLEALAISAEKEALRVAKGLD